METIERPTTQVQVNGSSQQQVEVVVSQIEARLPKLTYDKLIAVLGYITHIDELPNTEEQADPYAHLPERLRQSEAFETMLMSQSVLAKDWLRPEEDEAWAYLKDITEDWERPTGWQDEEDEEDDEAV